MRYRLLDDIRGAFVIGMILFHINYMLVNIFGDYRFENVDFWINLQYYGKIGFLFLSGFSFSIAQGKYGEKLNSAYLKKILRLGVLSLIIILASYLYKRDETIYFGIIQYFTVSYILLLAFRKLRYWNFLIGIIFLTIGYQLEKKVFATDYFMMIGMKSAEFRALDYFPLLPNFGYALIGYSVGLFLIKKDMLKDYLGAYLGRLWILEFLGRRSLWIYFLHTPVIYVVLRIIYSI